MFGSKSGETLKIIIYGSSGHAKVVAYIIEKVGEHQIVGFIDDTKSDAGIFIGYPVYTNICDPCLEGIVAGIVAIGDNWGRACVVNKIVRQIPDFHFITVIHSSAQIGKGVVVGEGSVVMPGVCINADTFIGRHCILNTSSSIDHDCKVGDFASVAPGVVTGGNVTVGGSTAIGLGAKIIQKICIGKHTVIGAGSLVTKSVPDRVVAYGLPSKVVRHRNPEDPYL